MFSKLSVVVASVLVTLAAATGTPPPPVTPPTSDQCCNSVVPSSSAAASAVAALLGLDLSGLDVLVGLSCSPITVGNNWYYSISPAFDLTRNSCSSNSGSTTVVCDAPDKEWGGLIAINCIPVTL
ncbi:hydrophobin 2 [Mycena filopes]|nr:hydrophobin 2 [Mycena filopes]